MIPGMYKVPYLFGNNIKFGRGEGYIKVAGMNITLKKGKGKEDHWNFGEENQGSKYGDWEENQVKGT